MGPAPSEHTASPLNPSPTLYLSLGFVAGAVIALQIAVMRVFAVGSWTHFGSLVISLAMLGFSLSSVIIFLFKDWFDRHWQGSAATALFLFGPLTVAANLAAQQVPFNAIFIVSDPAQKWRLFANFVLYLLPFLSGAFFLGIIFLKSRTGFNRAYFADLTGSGLAGLVILAALYLFAPETIIVVPLVLWAAGLFVWFSGRRHWRSAVASLVVAGLSIAGYLLFPGLLKVPAITVTQYKGISYARNFPDAKRIYRSVSPFGDLQIYKSSYMHFAPGLSDNAAFDVPEVPPNTYVAMYIDGEGPEGIMRELPPKDAAYYRYLPAYYPYVLKQNPKTFVVQFGGDISTMVALHAGSQSVTAAESNPAILAAFRDPRLKQATSDILSNPRLHVIDGDGRLYLANTNNRYDVIDLSLAGSVGLSNPGGFAVVEKYDYTREAMLDYMRALADGGILSITLWNKEEPPKSVLKFYATIAAAAQAFDASAAAQSLFVASSYLSTTTVLYKKGGFTSDEIAKLSDYTQAMSFDEIYSPGFAYDAARTETLLAQYRDSIFGNGSADATSDGTDATAPAGDNSQATADAGTAPTGGTPQAGAADGSAAAGSPPADGTDMAPMPATTMGRLVWHYLIHGGWPEIAGQYVFDVRPLTNDRPYFAGYEKLQDLPKTLDRLDLFQDDWGYIVLWATLGVAAVAALSLILVPVVFGWRAAFARVPGKLGTIVYFACLGLGYIMVEVGLISRFTLALSNPTISASVLISGMLVFSGLGSLVSERIIERARGLLPLILVAIAALLVTYAFALAPVLDWIDGLAYPLRLLLSVAVVAPPAFLMGFPMATGMGWLARLDKQHMFVWAWGINGCFSVVGAAAMPIIATGFGLSMVLEVSGVAYLVAIPAFFALLRRPTEPATRLAIA